MEQIGSPGTSSPLTNLLHECVERVLASWCRTDGEAQPPPGASERFLAALAGLEQAAAALCGEGGVQPPAPALPSDEVEGARSYAHLAGLLPRALERVVAFDAAAAVVRRPDGELVIDAISKADPALSDLVRERALSIHRFVAGGVEVAQQLPPRPLPLRSALHFPLVSGGLVVGIIYIASTRDDAFTEKDLDVLMEIAGHASGAFRKIDAELRALRATPRQAQVLALVASGLSDKEIAVRLGVSPRTVRTHLERVLRDHGFASRTEAATAWLRGERTSS
jgi:DNA-binding CsgD family transcriptional regulator